jgi:hypothetical protein
MCRILGPSREEEFFSRKKIHAKHLIFLSDPQPPPAGICCEKYFFLIPKGTKYCGIRIWRRYVK